MDEIAHINKNRWDELSQAGVAFSRPWFDLDIASARRKIDRRGFIKDIAGKDVLCLAAGGGQQSAAFGLLSANVTVVDLSQTQLKQDLLAAAHYDLQIKTLQADIRDISQLDENTFDLVWQGYSMAFVPDVCPVFDEIARVIRPGGLYYLDFANPFSHHSIDEEAWDGHAYPLLYPYLDGQEITALNEKWGYWEVENNQGQVVRVPSPKEYRHYLSTLINLLIERGFLLLGLWEQSTGDPAAEPGSWEHFQAFAPPFLELWAQYRPEILGPKT
jgi:ubiquinone/menaquinone biosynthesis C-methylase UbiE